MWCVTIGKCAVLHYWLQWLYVRSYTSIHKVQKVLCWLLQVCVLSYGIWYNKYIIKGLRLLLNWKWRFGGYVLWWTCGGLAIELELDLTGLGMTVLVLTELDWVWLGWVWLDWVWLHWVWLGWVWLGWVWLDWVWLGWGWLSWSWLDWTGSDWAGSDWTGSDWTGSDWAGSDWAGSDWTGFDMSIQKNISLVGLCSCWMYEYCRLTSLFCLVLVSLILLYTCTCIWLEIYFCWSTACTSMWRMNEPHEHMLYIDYKRN